MSARLRAFAFLHGLWRFLWLGVLLGFPCTTLAQDTRALETLLTGVATELAQRFPAVSGEVVKVEGDQVYLSLGTRDHLTEGMQLTLVREGETLKRPTTGEVLGRVENELGMATVGQVFERYAVATVTQFKGTEAVRSGDKVRISAGRIPLGLLPVVVQTRQAVPQEELSSALQRALEATGRFRLVSRDQVSIWLLKRGALPDGVVPPELLPELAQALQFSYVLMPLVKDLRGTTVLETLLLVPEQPQTPIATAAAILPAAALARQVPVPPVVVPPVAVPPVQPTPPPPPETTARAEPHLEGVFKAAPSTVGASKWNLADTMTELHKLPEAIQGFDGSDIDGDGRPEIATLSVASISLYRIEGERLVRVDTYEFRQQGKLLSVQLLRLGTASQVGIVVNRQAGDGTVDSFILTLQGQRLVVWREHLDDILLAVDTDGDGVKESLWGQPFDRGGFFRRGLIRQYTVTSEALELQANLTVPPAFRATGATLARFSPDAPRHLVFVDSGHHLQVYRGEEALWRSREEVGGGSVSADLDRMVNRDLSRESFFFEAVPATVDVDGDGIEEVLLARNAEFLGGFVPNLNQYSGGDVFLLRKERYGFNLTPVSPEFNGIVSGVAVLPGSPRLIALAVTRKKGFLKGAETTVFLSRLP